MSFETFWENINDEFTESIRQDLDNYMQKISDKPSYIGDIKLLSLNFGSISPEVVLLDLTDPFPEFYQFDDLDHPCLPGNVHSSSFIQPHLSCPGHCSHFDHAEENSSITNVDHYENQASYSNYQPNQRAVNHSSPHNNITSPQGLHQGRQAWEAALDVDSDNEVEIDLEDLRVGHSAEHLGTQTNFFRRSQEYFNSFPPSPPSYFNSAHQTLHSKHDEDIQSLLKLAYSGDFSLTLVTSLNIDYPIKNFASLPIQLRVTGFTFETQAVVAYLQSKLRFSLIPDILSDSEILRELRIESLIGDATRHTLKNVDKVESFVLDLVRQMVTKKLVFPNFITHFLKPPS